MSDINSQYYNSQSYNNGSIRGAVQMKYQKYSGIDTFSFKVKRPYFKPSRFTLDGTEKGESVLVANVGIWPEGHLENYLISSKHRKLYHGILMYGKGFYIGPRVERYMSFYKAYEYLKQKRDIPFSAIRHSLAHASEDLENKKIKTFLLSEFNSLTIDLSNNIHLRLFFTYLGKLIILLDNILFEELTRKLEKPNQSVQLKSNQRR